MRKVIFATALAALAVPAAPALAQHAMVGYTIRSTSMRAGPDFDYPIVRRIARNARVDVYGCLRDRSWCDVGYRYDRGWIFGRDLVVDDRGRRRGIVDYSGIGVLSFIFGSYWDSHYRGRSFYTERPRWERRYYDNYRPNWGPRPQTPPAYQQHRGQPVQPVRPGAMRPPVPMRPQPQPAQPRPVQPQPFHPLPQPRATQEHHRGSPTQVPPSGARRGFAPGATPTPVNPTPPAVRRGNPALQSAGGQQHHGKKGEGAKQP
ncbi:hypothetical protein GCM10009087_09830 [Sphingomonas oligophenolica]|uniref:SH3 domain-containing protein n=1 Tax=Sphingomonas oligophenolica TaxID=301154 RepID=A0ABU9Y8P1_9SPHN